MNKYQEALNKVLMDNPKIQLTTSDIHSSILVLKKLVDKETPKKPKRKRLYYNCHNGECDKAWLYNCPVCNSSIGEDINYCYECSQKLDWSDE